MSTARGPLKTWLSLVGLAGTFLGCDGGQDMWPCSESADCPAGLWCDPAEDVCKPPPCAPACGARECGLDPVCGESCGECTAPESCQPDGRCACLPDCEGKCCGDDGCGGSCPDTCGAGQICDPLACACAADTRCEDGALRCAGEVLELCAAREWQTAVDCAASGQVCEGNACRACRPGALRCGGAVVEVCAEEGWSPVLDCAASGQICRDGACEPACIPACGGRECGPDPVCGTLSCGTCEPGCSCSADGVCVGSCTCVPECGALECGPDPVCGLSCGECELPLMCSPEGVCGYVDVPCCEGLECGLDPCMGTLCGTCEPWETCSEQGQCECVPSCADLECGPDPLCGTSCGECTPPETCSPDGQCGCVPDCAGRACGPDPLCGQDCGACLPAWTCDPDGQCVCNPDCQGLECGPDPLCGLSCGACGPDLQCGTDGVCAGALGAACPYDQIHPEAPECDATHGLSCLGEVYPGTPCTTDADCDEDVGLPSYVNPDCLELLPGLYVCSASVCTQACAAAEPLCPPGFVGVDLPGSGCACIPSCEAPDCVGRECGDDSCGGSCGACQVGESCNPQGLCEPCVPDCLGRVCGDDGCGNSCGVCAAGEECVDGLCVGCLVPAAFGDLGMPFGLVFQYTGDYIEYQATLDDAPLTDAFELELFEGYGVFAGGLTPGTWDLADHPEELQFATCGACVRILADLDLGTGDVRQHYLITGGTLTLTSVQNTLSGFLTNATFEHVTLDAEFVSHPVGDGCFTSIDFLAFDAMM